MSSFCILLTSHLPFSKIRKEVFYEFRFFGIFLKRFLKFSFCQLSWSPAPLWCSVFLFFGSFSYLKVVVYRLPYFILKVFCPFGSQHASCLSSLQVAVALYHTCTALLVASHSISSCRFPLCITRSSALPPRQFSRTFHLFFL